MASGQHDELIEPHYDIKGIPLRGGKIPCRYECNVWSEDAVNSIQVSLFIRALQKMYETPLKDPLSFYQIACGSYERYSLSLVTDNTQAIHGYPGFEWNHGGPPPFHPPGGTDTTFVYCTHNSSLFPTWHRPYMLLFEVSTARWMLAAYLTILATYPPAHVRCYQQGSRFFFSRREERVGR